MLQKLELFVANLALKKYLPTRWMVDLWIKSTGYRSYICAALYIAVYVAHRAHFGFLADDTLANGLMNGLMGTGAAALLEKFKAYQPQVDEAVDSLAKNVSANN